jgi:hypothetical protein
MAMGPVVAGGPAAEAVPAPSAASAKQGQAPDARQTDSGLRFSLSAVDECVFPTDPEDPAQGRKIHRRRAAVGRALPPTSAARRR